jgi:antitoxin component of RelBE/YafQ-DinJ toxin-antitoxin module
MNTIIIEHADNSTAEMLQTLAKKLGLPVKTRVEKQTGKSSYNAEFLSKIKRSEADAKAGRTHKVKLDDIWK